MKDELTQLREELEAKKKEFQDLKEKITNNYIIHYCKTYKDKNGDLVESRAYIKAIRVSSADIDDWVAKHCISTSEVQYSECYYLKSSRQLEMLFEKYRNLYIVQSLCDSENADPCIKEYLNSPEISLLLKELGSSITTIFPEAKEELKKFLEDNYNVTLDEKAIDRSTLREVLYYE